MSRSLVHAPWLVALLVVTASAQTPATLVVGRHVMADGTLGGAAVITLQDGKITGITPGDAAPEGADVARYPAGVASPGLIDLASTVSSHTARSATARSIDPDISAIAAVDWTHRDFAGVVAGGTTTAVVAPDQTNLVSGVAAVIKTAATGRHVLRADGPLTVALGPQVWRFDRAPTSRSGALAMLRAALAEARDGAGSPRLQAAAGGRLDTMLFCAEAMDVSAGLRLFDAHPPRAVVYTGDETDLGAEFDGRDTVAVVGPYAFDTPPATLAFAGILAGQGVDVALAGGYPQRGRDSLRVTAALAVRYGLPAASARLAMTATAARAAGVDARIGRLAPGYDADLVIFSDDPLRLDARVLAVYIDGARVHADHTGGVDGR